MEDTTGFVASSRDVVTELSAVCKAGALSRTGAPGMHNPILADTTRLLEKSGGTDTTAVALTRVVVGKLKESPTETLADTPAVGTLSEMPADTPVRRVAVGSAVGVVSRRLVVGPASREVTPPTTPPMRPS